MITQTSRPFTIPALDSDKYIFSIFTDDFNGTFEHNVEDFFTIPANGYFELGQLVEETLSYANARRNGTRELEVVYVSDTYDGAGVEVLISGDKFEDCSITISAVEKVR